MPRKPKHSEDEIRALYARYQAGATLAELAVDCDPSTIMREFRSLGLARRQGGNWSGSHNPARDRRIIALYLNKTIYTDIGREFGISRQRVQQILKRAGYPKNRGSEELSNETLDIENDV